MIHNLCSRKSKYPKFDVKSDNGGSTLTVRVSMGFNFNSGDIIVMVYKGLINVYTVDYIDYYPEIHACNLSLKLAYPNDKPLSYKIARFFRQLF